MKYLRRFLWYIAKRLLGLTILAGVLIIAFYLAMNTANITILLKDGMAMRAEVVMKQEDPTDLTKYFDENFLQVDAALVYINGGRVPTNEDKKLDSPYNTYLYKGLPPGAICNPGMNSLYAAMNPDSTNYYYYALNPATGLHEFSRTYEEHQRRLAGFSNG